MVKDTQAASTRPRHKYSSACHTKTIDCIGSVTGAYIQSMLKPSPPAPKIGPAGLILVAKLMFLATNSPLMHQRLTSLPVPGANAK